MYACINFTVCARRVLITKQSICAPITAGLQYTPMASLQAPAVQFTLAFGFVVATCGTPTYSLNYGAAYAMHVHFNSSLPIAMRYEGQP